MAKKLPAAALNSKTSAEERRKITENLKMKEPTLKLLYITPEMAATDNFRQMLTVLNKVHQLARFAIDEAHCVSEWGHDFRPDYSRLGS